MERSIPGLIAMMSLARSFYENPYARIFRENIEICDRLET